MNITFTVTQNSDNTNTVSWKVTGFELDENQDPIGLHTITVGILYDRPADFDWETVAMGLYSWSYSNPNNGKAELEGSRTLDPAAWKSDWTVVTYRAGVCQYNSFENPISDQYNCMQAQDVIVERAASQTPKPKGKGRPKKS